MYLTADPWVANSIPSQSHTFMKIDHEIDIMAILLPSADSSRVVVSYKQKYVQEVLVNRFSQACPGNVWLGELTVPHDHNCWLGR